MNIPDIQSPDGAKRAIISDADQPLLGRLITALAEHQPVSFTAESLASGKLPEAQRKQVEILERTAARLAATDSSAERISRWLKRSVLNRYQTKPGPAAFETK